MAEAKVPVIHCLYDKLEKLSELKSHPKNRNKHPEDQIKRLADILKYQGWRYPVKVSKLSGFVTSGHGRIEAAKLNGWRDVPVNFQDYESEEQEYADVQADNAIASWAELDLSGINSDIGELGPDFDINLLGIKDFVLEPADKLEPQCDEDEVPEHVEPKTKLGDVYQLGRHRLMCGDSTSIDAVEKLMAGDKASFVFTSPPYNGDTSVLEGSFNNNKGSKTLYKDNETDAKTSEEYIQFNRDIFAAIHAIASEDITICYNINYNKKSPSEYIDIVSDAKSVFPLRETVIWEKQMAISLQGNNFTRIYEFVFVFGAQHLVMNKGHTDCVKNLWKIANINANTADHKACFPVALPKQGMELLAKPEAVVFEPFGGSGSTIIACEKTNRRCFMMELDPHYCDVIVARWEKYTGQKAELING
jgi:DNA modification methylase